MLTTTRKLTVAQAARPAVVAECVACGGKAAVIVETDDTTVDHRCATGVVGATWVVVERPRRTAAERANAFVGLTVDEVRAAHLGLPGPRGGERMTRAGEGSAA